MSKIIHCAIWGDIEITDLARQIIDTPFFQRLHYIRQCGFSYKVFPCSTHTRFQHSIGVYHLVKLFINTILSKQPSLNNISARTIELIAIRGLIHDLGHGPFSHTFDVLVSKLLQDRKDSKYDHVQTHEQRTEWLFQHMIKNGNPKIDISLDEVRFILSGLKNPDKDVWYDHLVYNPYYFFDLDKIDYLLRDSHHFGLKQNIDVTRILQNCRVINNRLCFCSRIIDEIKFVFDLRHKMYHSIYTHHKVKMYEHLFIHLCSLFYKNEILYSLQSVQSFIELTDISILSWIQKMSLWKNAEIRKPLPIQLPIIQEQKPVLNIETVLSSMTFYERKDVIG